MQFLILVLLSFLIIGNSAETKKTQEKKNPVLELSGEKSDAHWQKLLRSHELYLVFLYNESECDATCSQFLQLYGQVSEEYPYYAKFALLKVGKNSKQNNFVKKYNVQKFPVLLAFQQKPETNPYTHEIYRNPLQINYQQLLTSPRELQKFIKKFIPFVITSTKLTMDVFDTLVRDNQPKKIVVLFTRKNKISPIFKALSTKFITRGLNFTIVNEKESKEVIEEFDVKTFPSVGVVGKDSKLLDFKKEDFSYEALYAFLSKYALEEKEAKETKDEDGIGYLTGAVFDKLAWKSRHSSIIYFKSSTSKKSPVDVQSKEWLKFRSSLFNKYGPLIRAGVVDCETEQDLCDRFEVTSESKLLIFPIELTSDNKLSGEEKLERKKSDVVSTVINLDEATQIAAQKLPNYLSPLNSPSELNQFLSSGVSQKKFNVFIMTKKSNPSELMKSIAALWEDRALIGLLSNPDTATKQRFGVHDKSLPIILGTFPSAKDGQVLSAVYDKKIFGGFSFTNLNRFLMEIQRQMGPTSTDTFKPMNVKEIKSIPYLNQDNFRELCGSKSLCAIGFFDQSVKKEDEKPSKQEEILLQIAKKSNKRGNPYHFGWVDGGCFSTFSSKFDVDPMNIPTLVVYSPKKNRYAKYVGVLDVESGVGFLQSVLSGRIGTSVMSTLPESPLEKTKVVEECQLRRENISNSNVTLPESEDEDMGDMMAEILAEEEKKKTELEEQLKQEALERERLQAEKEKEKKSKKKKKRRRKKGKKKRKNKKKKKDEL